MEELDNVTLKDIVITKQDLTNLTEFFNVFEITPTPDLAEVIARCTSSENITLEDQEQVRVGLCASMISSAHPMFKDELFEPIIVNASKIVYEDSFHKEVAEKLDT